MLFSEPAKRTFSLQNQHFPAHRAIVPLVQEQHRFLSERRPRIIRLDLALLKERIGDFNLPQERTRGGEAEYLNPRNCIGGPPYASGSSMHGCTSPFASLSLDPFPSRFVHSFSVAEAAALSRRSGMPGLQTKKINAEETRKDKKNG